MSSILMKAAEDPAASMSIAEVVSYGALAFLLVFALVSTRIVMECVRKKYMNPALVGIVLYGTSLGPFLLILLALYGVLPESDGVLYAAFSGLVLWIVAVVIYTVLSAPKKRAEDQDEHARREALYEEVVVARKSVAPPIAEGEFTVDDVVEEVIDAAEPPPTPRRAVSLPAAESDRSSPSEQTIKRMSVEQITGVENKPKPPRASEIPENPILPDEEVKIRCVDCDRKMKAEGPKFMKQRRCPSCKAEPFRYMIIQ